MIVNENSNNIVLYFDIDQTLLQVDLKEKDEGRNLLSKSAAMDLSRSKTGTISEPVLFQHRCESTNKKHTYKAKLVRAIARKKFQEVFTKIKSVNEAAGRKVVSVRILTNGNFTKNGIVNVLKQIYPDFPDIDEFSNIDRRKKGYPLNKGFHIFLKYGRELEKNGIQSKNVYLIDDMVYNCTSAEKWGFKAIHMKTNPKGRGRKDSYEESKGPIFNELLDIIKSARPLFSERGRGEKGRA